MALDQNYITIQMEAMRRYGEATTRPQRRHVAYKCTCNQSYCQFCDGGLMACTVCGGFEGSLPTECPGVKLLECTLDDIYIRCLDFYDGKWHYDLLSKMIAYRNAKGDSIRETEKLPGA